MADDWGPLGPLAGEWEGDGGLDTAYSHVRGEVIDTPYRERLSFKPFGPVLNGRQALYGLDYRTAMWRGDEANPFHTEVGYWLWDGDNHELLRGFVVPRGITVLAGAIVEPDARTFTLHAEPRNGVYSIGENTYLADNASTLSYTVTVYVDGDEWSYEETTMVRLEELAEPLAHRDRNTLRRVALDTA